jgi:Chaperone of endosialidase
MKTTIPSTNYIHRSLGQSALLFASLLIVCFGFFSGARAVSPPPDGGYANGNTAEGTNALFNLTTGAKNTADGYLALFSNSSGQYNMAAGSQALYSNTTGSNNTGVGFDALFHNTTGNDNTAYGYIALLHNTAGAGNTAVGSQALMTNIAGSGNTAVGSGALFFNTYGSENIAVGGALVYNTAGHMNTAIGDSALLFNTTGSANVAIGFEALLENSTGRNNTAVGVSALQNNTIGTFNTALGIAAGRGVTTASNVIVIGATGDNVSNSCFIGNIRGATTSNNNAVPVLIDSAGQLGTANSSRRYKSDIKPIDEASESILGLKPVSFHYKVHKDTTPQFGLIAEDVAKVDPDLVVYDTDGKPFTVRYDAVNTMLLNEFLKEHRRVEQQSKNIQEQEATITELKRDFQSKLTEQQNRINVLASGLEKVTAQLATGRVRPTGGLALRKAAPRTVLNNP